MSAFGGKADIGLRKGRAVAARRRPGDLRGTADRSALIVVVSAIIHGPRYAVRKGGAFQCVIWDVERQNLLIHADIVIFVHNKPSVFCSLAQLSS
jgi:hypothetical protein